MSHHDTEPMFEDEDTYQFVLEFLLAWRQFSKDEKARRAVKERQMREVMRRNNKQRAEEGRSLMVGVCFKNWKAYLVIRMKERKEEREERRKAIERMAESKRAPTKAMLKRRASVIGSERKTRDKTASIFAAASLAVAADERTKELQDIEGERMRGEKEFQERSGFYRVLRSRQMRALSVSRGELVRLRTTSAAGRFQGKEPSPPEGGRGRAASGDTLFGSLFYSSPSHKEHLSGIGFFSQVKPEESDRVSTAPAAGKRGRGLTSAGLLGEQREFLRAIAKRREHARGISMRATSAPSPGPEAIEVGAAIFM